MVSTSEPTFEPVWWLEAHWSREVIQATCLAVDLNLCSRLLRAVQASLGVGAAADIAASAVSLLKSLKSLTR